MIQGNLLDYAKVLVRNKLNLAYGMTREEGQILPNFDNMLEDLPVYLRKAVLELQMVNLIPPTELSFVSLDRKREALKPDGDVRYNYYALPDDFRELDDLYIESVTNQPKYADNEFQLQSRSLIEARPFFTIVQVDGEAGEKEYRLIIEPFPADDKNIYLKYWITGTNLNSTTLKEKYWDAVVSVVMRDMGLMSEFEADNRINDRITSERSPQGRSASVGARPKTRPSYFTNTSSKIRRTVF